MKVITYDGHSDVANLGGSGASYIAKLVPQHVADFECLRSELQFRRVKARGRFLLRRKIAMVVFNSDGSYPLYHYRFRFDEVDNFHPLVRSYMERLQAFCAGSGFPHRLNHAICTFYEDGRAGIGMHSDNPQDITDGSLILDISLGAPRLFCLESVALQRRVEIVLQSGSMIAFDTATNAAWKHGLPAVKPANSVGPRISIVFRSISTMSVPIANAGGDDEDPSTESYDE